MKSHEGDTQKQMKSHKGDITKLNRMNATSLKRKPHEGSTSKWDSMKAATRLGQN
jgi:hypothetical protein